MNADMMDIGTHASLSQHNKNSPPLTLEPRFQTDETRIKLGTIEGIL